MLALTIQFPDQSIMNTRFEQLKLGLPLRLVADSHSKARGPDLTLVVLQAVQRQAELHGEPGPGGGDQRRGQLRDQLPLPHHPPLAAHVPQTQATIVTSISEITGQLIFSPGQQQLTPTPGSEAGTESPLSARSDSPLRLRGLGPRRSVREAGYSVAASSSAPNTPGSKRTLLPRWDSCLCSYCILNCYNYTTIPAHCKLLYKSQKRPCTMRTMNHKV